MKEVLPSFAAEIFRPIVTLLIPGFWGTIFILIWLFLNYPVVWKFANAHEDGFALSYVVISTAAGLIFEDVGGKIENYIYNRLPKRDKENWCKYLRCTRTPEPCGMSYIRFLVMRMKFESGMAVAGLTAIAGVVLMPISICYKFLVVLFISSLSFYLVFETISSAGELVNTRAAMFGEAAANAADSSVGQG